MKIKRQISERATKRFKWMCIAGAGMVAINLLAQATTQSMIEE